MAKNQARQRLPEKVLEWLFEHTGEALTAEAMPEKRWQGRCVSCARWLYGGHGRYRS